MYVVLQHCFRLGGGGEVLNISVLMLVLFISQKDQMKMYRLLKKKWGGGAAHLKCNFLYVKAAIYTISNLITILNLHVYDFCRV